MRSLTRRVMTPARFQPFNPFTTPPVRGVHWDCGPKFGQPLNRRPHDAPFDAADFRRPLLVRYVEFAHIWWAAPNGHDRAMNSGNVDGSPAEAVVALERAALDRWGKGDPSGFLEINAPDVVYFDPFLARRIDGIDELARHYDGIRGKIWIERYELLNPVVQVVGDAAVLTFNYVSWGNEGEARWNCTEVYRHDPAGWRIVQTHWSYTNAGTPTGGIPTT